jgi:hypothetical protein
VPWRLLGLCRQASRSTHYHPWYEIEVSGHFHAPAALCPGRDSRRIFVRWIRGLMYRRASLDAVNSWIGGLKNDINKEDAQQWGERLSVSIGYEPFTLVTILWLRPCVTIRNAIDFKASSYWRSTQPPNWRNSPCRLSMASYSIYLQLSFISGSGIDTGCRLDDRGLIPGSARDFSLLHTVQTVCGPTQSLTQCAPWRCIPRGKAAGAWSWPITSI